ncbi:helix-turn-helix transcriptional regulator [Amycolatopsis minnesotensis]|uniref:Scr1 family TA system antitoxin-like transcriptional regulator n=1 Tax=Amycolatopsis minnesotensis TaxID=337894 RepID=A0ABN2SMH4_9PSEU
MPPKPPGVKAKALGAWLRVCREEAGLSLREASEAADWDKSTLSRLETGKRNVSADEIAQLLGVFRVRGQVKKEIMALARTMDEPGWWGRSEGVEGLPKESVTLAEYEGMATRITNWAPLLIPGLLQTSDYTRAWLRGTGTSPVGIESRVAMRAKRQQILRTSVRYVAYLGESALRARVGDAATSARQLAALREAGSLGTVSIRVVPGNAGPHAGQLVTFLTLEFPSAPPVVLVELLRSSIFMDEQRQTEPYFDTVTRLAEVAMSEAESARLITHLQVRLTEHGEARSLG